MANYNKCGPGNGITKISFHFQKRPETKTEMRAQIQNWNAIKIDRSPGRLAQAEPIPANPSQHGCRLLPLLLAPMKFHVFPSSEQGMRRRLLIAWLRGGSVLFCSVYLLD